MKLRLPFLACGVLFLASQVFASNATVAKYVPPGHEVIEDNISWTCPEFTPDEQKEIQEKGDSIAIVMGYGSDKTCVVRDGNGNIVGIRQRGVLPGSKLLTHDPVSNTSTLQEWSISPGPIKTYSSNGVSVDFPTVVLTILSRSWDGGPYDDPLK